MYSLQFRQKVLQVKERDGLTFETAGKRFDVSARTVQRWAVRIEPTLTRNKPATKIDMEALERDVRDRPDAYQWERAQRWHVSQAAVCYALKRLRISVKKNAHASRSGSGRTPGIRGNHPRLPEGVPDHRVSRRERLRV